MSEETLLTESQIYAIHPVVEVDGRGDDMVRDLLIGMDLTESDEGMSSLELRFENAATVAQQGDYAFEYSENDLLSLGRSVTVKAGDHNDPLELFRGVVSGLEMAIEQDGQPRLIVLAEDALQKARLTRRTRLHAAGSVADIAAAVARDLGLTPSISGLDQQVDDQLQLNMSDLAFLRELARRFDADLQIVDAELRIAPRAGIRRGAVTLELGSQLLSVRVLADLSHQVNRVTYAGFDVTAGEEIHAESDASADLGPGRGRSGARFMQEAFGERSEHLSRASARNQAEAQALVNALYSERARRFVQAEGLALGNPNIRVGAHITLSGLGPRFDNTYFVTKTHHSFDTVSGYRTRFQAECAYLGE